MTPKCICKHKVAFFYSELTCPLTLNVTCSKLQRYVENRANKKLPAEQTPKKKNTCKHIPYEVTKIIIYEIQKILVKN